MPGKHHLRGFKIAKKIGSPLRGSWTMLPLGKKLDLPLACEVKMYFFLSCYCRAEKYWFPQQNTDFWVWEYWKAQIQLGSSVWIMQTFWYIGGKLFYNTIICQAEECEQLVILIVASFISKLLYSWLFIDPSEQHLYNSDIKVQHLFN